MERFGDLVRYTAEELAEMRRRGEDRTDWAKVRAMTEEELEASIAADPDDIHEELDWSKAFPGLPPLDIFDQVQVDHDIVAWFKEQGPPEDYQARINAVLRAYVDSRKPRAA